MTEIMLNSLVEEAMLAPSVHNVQPARWRTDGNSLILIEDMSRRLAVGDPRCNDADISLGAAYEGLKLAASRRGMIIKSEHANLPDMQKPFRAVVRCKLEGGGEADALAALVEQRTSWRGPFLTPTLEDRRSAQNLLAEDAAIVSDPEQLRLLAKHYDKASYGFMRDSGFRRELRGWMRLRRKHPDWSRDGLNAHAMALGGIEAIGAGIVLGPAFRFLDRLGIAPKLLAEGSKIEGAAAMVVFHRPVDEEPFESGAWFYRLWLRIEEAGFGAAVLAALADDTETAKAIAQTLGIPKDRRIVSAFRIGRRGKGQTAARARLPLHEILI
jgi:hypothetical protein